MRDYPTLIIEDEKPAARLLLRKLTLLGFQQIEMLHSVSQAKKWFSENKSPELIFLDIQLSDGHSFEIFEGLEISSAIIFTTAYDEFALKAFKMNSVDYLLKPISEEELAIAVEKFERTRRKPQEISIQEIRALLIPESSRYKSRFSVKIGHSIKLIAVDEIECIYSENKGTYIYTRDHGQYLLDSSLDQLEVQLDPAKFFRISRSHLIHITSIKNIAVHSNSRLRIEFQNYPSSDVIVSRERVNDFKSWLD